jgi:hypothetical protein
MRGLNLVTVVRNRNSRAVVPNYNVHMIALLRTDVIYFIGNHWERNCKFVPYCYFLGAGIA